MFPTEEEQKKYAYKIEVSEVTDINGDGAVDLVDVEYLLRNKKNVLTLLEGDGDFRSAECMEILKEADIVVTNPTHVAVALKYDQAEMQAPRLIAKGTELIAKKIIRIAKEHNGPVIENPPVARALFKMVDINQSIPPELYKAVAEILMFVYKMKNPPNKRPRN